MNTLSRRAFMGVGSAPIIDALKFTVNEDSQAGTITLTIPSGLTEQECTNIQYSLNGRTWVTFENHGQGLTITTPTLNAGDSVYFRGQATLISKSSSIYSQFTTSSPTFKISASGNIMSLLGNSETLTDYAFNDLFMDCKSLTTAPALPATTLASYCYREMFYGCTKLTSAPELPATTLQPNCYRGMFDGCTSLTTAPILPATTLVKSCYNNMFHVCYRLNKITMLATDISAPDCLYSWVIGVAATGTFIKDPAMTTLPTGKSGIPSGWTIKDYLGPLKFTVNAGSPSGTITLTIPSGLTQEECTNIEYSLDGNTWVTFVNEGNGLTITTPTLNAGDSVYFRGQATLISKSDSVYSRFTTSSSTFKISASGSVMSLIGDSETLTNYAFYNLFYGCTSLTTAPALPATELANWCYQGMFQGCTSLTTAPELPATELSSHCYRSMFQGCSSLVNAPELPATTAEYYCYGDMFQGCTSLTTAPALPATELVNYCYQGMFQGCTSLTTAPELPATRVPRYGYNSMFALCSNINKITMLATTIDYNGLTSWVYGVAATGTFIKNPAMTTLPTGVNGIPSGWTVKDYLGPLKFTVNAGSPSGTITLTIPSGLTQQECTNIEYSLDGQTWVTFVNEGNGLTITTPTLIAGDSVYFRGQGTLISKSSSVYSQFTTSSSDFKISASGSIMSLIGNSDTLTDYAFFDLFYNCKSLTTAPELPATTLASRCYMNMFSGCNQLNKITMLATDISASNCLSSWLYGVAATGTFIKNPAMTTLPTGYSGIPSGWTVEDYAG